MTTPADGGQLVEKLRLYSRQVGGEPDMGKWEEVVLLVAPGSSPANVVAAASALKESGKRLRIVGDMVTLEVPQAWEGLGPVTLTELGAYQLRTRWQASRGAAEDIRGWLRSAVAFSSAEAEELDLFGSAAARVFQEVLDYSAIIEGLRLAHEGDQFVSTSEDWPLGCLVRAEGTAEKEGANWDWTARLMALSAVGIAGSVGRFCWDYWAARATFTRLAELREVGRDAEPELWVGLIPDWERGSCHLRDALVEPMLERGAAVGLLLLESISEGEREEESLRKGGEELWPALSKLGRNLKDIPVVQCVLPRSPRLFVAGLLAASRDSLRAVGRVASGRPKIQIQQRSVDISADARGVSRLLTIDVFRATMARFACRESAGRLANARGVVLCAANTPGAAAVASSLKRMGAKTADHMHGLGADFYHGIAESRVDTTFVWTPGDREALASSGREVVVGGAPIASSVSAAFRVEPTETVRLLFATSYLHRDYAMRDPVLGGVRGRRNLTARLLALVDLLEDQKPRDLSIHYRWRPHPAELRREVAEIPVNPMVEVSQGASLLSDLTWASAVVSVHSTVMLQAMQLGKPVFLHNLPQQDDIEANAFVEKARRFFFPEDIVGALLECLGLLRRGDQQASAPERRALDQVMGSAGIGMPDAVERWLRS